MPTNLDNLDPESRKIIEQAMSMQSNSMVMGLDPVRRKEQEQLAADMEKKNAEARRKRGARIAGEDRVPESPKQAPIKRGATKGGMVEQKTTIMPAATLPPEPVAEPKQVEAENAAMKNAFARINKSAHVEPEPIEDEGNEEEQTYPGYTAEETQSIIEGERQIADEGVAMVEAAAKTPEKKKTMPKQKSVMKTGKDDSLPKVTNMKEQELNDRLYEYDPDAANNPLPFTRIEHLPSKGLFYSRYLEGQALKLIDNYTLDDILDDSITTRTALNTIIGRRIRGIDPQDIASCDEPYILHWLRASSFPKQGMRHPGYVCPHCKFDTSSDPEFNDFRIGFRNLKFELNKDINQLYELHRENGYHKGFLADGRECHVYIHRLRHSTELGEYVEKWQVKNNTIIPNSMRNIVGAATITEIEGCEDLDAKVNYICNIPIGDRKSFEQLIIDGTVTCSIIAQMTCPMCGGVVETPYPFLVRSYISGL